MGCAVALRLAVLLSVLMLGACGAKMPPLNFSVSNVGPSGTKLDAEVKSLTVTIARPEEATGEINAHTAAITGLWKESVEDSLNKMAIFSDDSKTKASLSVKVLKLDVSQIFPGATTETTARYEIIDRATGVVLYANDVSSVGDVPGDHSLVAAVKIRESVNRAIQNNIAQFLQALGTAKLSKPVSVASSS